MNSISPPIKIILLGDAASSGNINAGTALLLLIPLVAFGIGIILLTRHGERMANQHQRGRRPYRFTSSRRDEFGKVEALQQSPARASGLKPTAISADQATETVRDAIRGARDALRPHTTTAQVSSAGEIKPPPIPIRRSNLQIGVPQKAAPAKADPRVALAPTGFWIAAGAAPVGSRVRFRWSDGKNSHQGAVIFTPGTATGGHFVPTLARPHAALITGIDIAK